MGKIENVYAYTDLLAYAEDNNICSWNEAIDLMKKDGIIPFYESGKKTIYASDEGEPSSNNPKLKKIIDGFCEEEGVDFITIIDE